MISLLAALLILLPSAASAAPANELIANGGFEAERDANGVPRGWGFSRFDSKSAVSLDTRTAHQGRRAVRIDGDAQGRAGATASFKDAAVDPAAVYLLSAWVKTAGTSAHEYRTSARITSVGANGEVLRSDYRVCAPGPYDWTYYEWLVTLPAGTRQFNLVLFHHGAGTAWWDDVSLRKARRARALSPTPDALVPDPRPTFRWEAIPGQAMLVLAPGDSDAGVRRYSVSGGTFTLPAPLSQGKEYRWRVMAEDTDGTLTITLPPGEDADSRFYAGTWAQQTGAVREKLAEYQKTLGPLQAFAARNRMWDSFALLANATAQGEKLLATTPADPGKARAALNALWEEPAVAVPWWRTIFLDDPGLFQSLNLDAPGMGAVKAAVARQDWPAARAALLAYYRRRKGPSYYGKYEQPPARNPNRVTDPAADALLTHRLAVHSYKEPTFDLGRDIDWHVRPNVDIEWPTKLHRHFHWETIAAAYRRTGNEKYAEELVQELLDWAKDNPMERWDPDRKRWAWSTLNTTIRIYSSWINSWLQIRDSASWNADAQFVFLTCLREHGRFLMTHAAKQGNWVVAEARGLVELGIMFPEFKEAKEWRDEGYRRLQHELAVQVLADGVHVERTPGYHAMTLDCFLQPALLGLHNGVAIPGRDQFVTKLEQMHEFYLYGSKPNHRMEQIGDSGMMNVDGQLRRGWEMFRREDMRWLLTNGKEGKPPVYRSYAFGDSGFYVSRSAWNDSNALWSILDWGGFLGHCHEDMGQLSLYAYGSELLIDTGIYSYEWALRVPFHETIGHNTVLVDGKAQQRRDPLSAHWSSTALMDVFHGTTDNSEPLLHERTVAFRQPNEAGPGYWLVVDRLTGKGSHRLDQRWHATERLAAQVQENTLLLTGKPGNTDQPSLVIAGMPQARLQTAVTPGAVSYEWYKKIPVDVAQFTLEGEMPATFVTVLYPTPPGIPPAQVRLAPLPALLNGAPGAATALDVTITDRGRTFRDRWLINHTGTGTVAAAGVESDARVAYLRDMEERQSWALSEGSLLRWNGTNLFRAAAKVEGAGVAPQGEETAIVCTAGRDLRFRVPGAIRVNEAPYPGPRAGEELMLKSIAPAPVPIPPKAPGGPRFTVDAPAPEQPATAFFKPLPSGTAIPDGSVRAEAEAFSGQGGGAVEAAVNRVGASGSSLFHWDNAGHWLEWKLPVAKAGRYRLILRACGAEARALRRLTVNGRTPKAGAAIECAATGGWSRDHDDWCSFLAADAAGQPILLDLPAGTTTLRLENVDGHSLNLDWLALVPKE